MMTAAGTPASNPFDDTAMAGQDIVLAGLIFIFLVIQYRKMSPYLHPSILPRPCHHELLLHSLQKQDHNQ
jgi:hypothetical protein